MDMLPGDCREIGKRTDQISLPERRSLYRGSIGVIPATNGSRGGDEWIRRPNRLRQMRHLRGTGASWEDTQKKERSQRSLRSSFANRAIIDLPQVELVFAMRCGCDGSSNTRRAKELPTCMILIGKDSRSSLTPCHELALEMLDEQGALLPHAWVAGDDEMGRPSPFRLKLRDRNERYLLAVPSNTLIRDIEELPPERTGRGPLPWNPFQRMDHWREALSESAWTTIEVRDGEKGPLVVDVVKRRIRARTTTNGTGPEELLFITRERQHDETFKHDYYLSSADSETPLKELARVSRAAHRIEECFRRAKGEAGLGDYQVLDRLRIATS